MQFVLFTLFSFILPSAVLSLDSLLFSTKYGEVRFYSKPEPNYIAGEFSPSNAESTKVLFFSRISDKNREISLTDAYKNVIIRYTTTPHDIYYIQIGQFSFIGHMARDNILHLPQTEIPPITNGNGDTHLHLYNTIYAIGESNITAQYAINLAFLTREFELVEDLSQSFGELFNSQGREYPSVMAIYIASKSLINMKSQLLNAIENDTPLREARDSECIVGEVYPEMPEDVTCLELPKGTSCLGLCGPGNTCWSQLCGDCCFHKGCADHDTCCAVYGMLHPKCMLPSGFSCAQYNCN